MNAVDPIFNKQIFDAAYNVGVKYMDMAMTLSEPNPEDPFHKPGIKLGDYQFEKAKEWEQKGLLALVGIGVEPGMADVFARYAQDHLFDEIDEIGIRDGANITIDGYEFAPNFSIWTTIEECLNPPVIWEKDKGWFTTEPFSEHETFDFPEIGPIDVVNVEHEEVLLVPRWVEAKRVTFKYGLGDQFIGVLKTLHMLGLDNKEKINVKGVQVAAGDVVAACLPDRAHLGEKMHGKTCVGTWVKGVKAGQGDGDYVEIYRSVLRPGALEFSPQLILISAGYDIYYDAPLGAMEVTPAGFAALTALIMELAHSCCQGRMVMCLEGGYHLDGLRDSVKARVQQLAGGYPTGGREAGGRTAPVTEKIIDSVKGVHKAFWSSL